MYVSQFTNKATLIHDRNSIIRIIPSKEKVCLVLYRYLFKTVWSPIEIMWNTRRVPLNRIGHGNRYGRIHLNTFLFGCGGWCTAREERNHKENKEYFVYQIA